MSLDSPSPVSSTNSSLGPSYPLGVCAPRIVEECDSSSQSSGGIQSSWPLPSCAPSEPPQTTNLCRSPAIENLEALLVNRQSAAATSNTIVAPISHSTDTIAQNLAQLALTTVSQSPARAANSPGSARDTSAKNREKHRLTTSDGHRIHSACIAQPPKTPRSAGFSSSSQQELPAVTCTIAQYEKQNFTTLSIDSIRKMSPGERLALHQKLLEFQHRYSLDSTNNLIQERKIIEQRLVGLENFWKTEREKKILDAIVEGKNPALVSASFILLPNQELIACILSDIRKCRDRDHDRCGKLTQFYWQLISNFPDESEAALAFQRLNEVLGHQPSYTPSSSRTLSSLSSQTTPLRDTCPQFDFTRFVERVLKKDKSLVKELAEFQRKLSTAITRQDLYFHMLQIPADRLYDCGSFKTPSTSISACISFNNTLINACKQDHISRPDPQDLCKKLLDLANDAFEIQDFATAFCILRMFELQNISATHQKIMDEKALFRKETTYKKTYSKLLANVPTYRTTTRLTNTCVHSFELLCRELDTIMKLPTFITELDYDFNYEKLQRFYEIQKLIAS